MRLDDFSGGRNTRVTPSKIGPTEAQIYTNIDNTSGALAPLKGHIDTGVSIGRWFTYFYADNQWVSKTVPSDFVEYRDHLYVTDGVSELLEYKNNVYSQLGITGPAAQLTVSDMKSNNVTITGVPNTTVGDLKSGTLRYKVVVIDFLTNLKVEKDYTYVSAFSELLSIDLTVALSTFTPGCTVEIYREVSGTYKQLISTTWTNSNIIYSDTIYNTLGVAYTKDVNSGVFSYVYTYYNSATGVESKPSLPSEDITASIGSIKVESFVASTDAQVDSIRLYRIGGLLTAYTLIATLANSTTPYIDSIVDTVAVGNQILDSIDNDIPLAGMKYISEAYAMLFAAKADKLYFSAVAKPYAWPITNFIDFDSDITGLGSISNGILVFTLYKTYIIIGTNPDEFSKYLLSSSQGCVNHNTIQFVDNNLIWVSSDGICATSGGQIEVLSLDKLGKLSFFETYGSAVLDNVYYLNYYTADGGSIIAFDFRYNKIIKDLTLTGKMIVAKKDSLYQYFNNTLRQLLVGTSLSMHWKSGILTEGSFTTLKTYKDVFIRYSGDLVFKLYIDGILSNTIALSGNTCYNLKATSIRKGYGIEFEVTGVGTVYEIEYKALGGQNE